MALLHWYILPIGIELGFNPAVLENFSLFVQIAEQSMTIRSWNMDELGGLHAMIRNFLMGFEKLYIGNDPEKISRARLCMFQLIHIPQHILWNGSIRIGSQAAVERTIGEVGHKIRSKKSPFANLANIIYERELVKLLCLYYPDLEVDPPQPKSYTLRPFQQIRVNRNERAPGQAFYNQLRNICVYLHEEFTPENKEFSRWGKIRLSNGTVLRSRLSELRGKPPERSYRCFQAQASNTSKPIFGEALAFFKRAETSHLLVVFHPVVNVQTLLAMVLRGNLSPEIQVISATALQNIVGTYVRGSTSKTYILRKHPALDKLSAEERGGCVEDDEDDVEEEI
jgi:hypothetical protein